MKINGSSTYVRKCKRDYAKVFTTLSSEEFHLSLLREPHDEIPELLLINSCLSTQHLLRKYLLHIA